MPWLWVKFQLRCAAGLLRIVETLDRAGLARAAMIEGAIDISEKLTRRSLMTLKTYQTKRATLITEARKFVDQDSGRPRGPWA
jgi:hypothetical protein